MLGTRRCAGHNEQGGPCRQPPLLGKDHCFWHDPEHGDEAQAARKLGGQRRRREATLSGAYDFEGLATVPDIRRLLEVAGYDLLGLENTVARARAIVSVVLAAGKLLETGELEDRVVALEAAMGAEDARPVFDLDLQD